jgi:TonB-dependent receptor
MNTPRIPQRPGPLGWFFSLLLALSLAVLPASAQSGSGSLSGKVTDAGSKAALAGALVRVVGTTLETTTGRSGDFYFPSVPAGSQTVRVSYLGLGQSEAAVTVVSSSEATVNIGVGEQVVEMEAFRVEGQKAGQARALNEQRASDNLKSIVTADALGRFPDQNAAETLGRISGVTLARDQGEGRFISVRGVDPNLNNTQLNGVNVPASQEDSRSVNLDVFPADLLDSIEVVKAVTPDMDGDAIGGSVNLKTQNAFSSEERILRVSAEGQFSDYTGDWGHKASVVWGDKFNDDKFGVLFAISDAHRFFGSDDRETDDNPWVKDAAANGTLYYTPGGDIQHREYVIDRLRRGVNFSLDFRPNPEDSFYLRGVYSHFSDYEHRFRTRFRGRAANAVPTSDTTGTVTGRPIVVDLKDRTEDNNVWSFSTGGEHRRGLWEIDYSASLAEAELDDPFRYQPAFSSPNTTWNYDFANPQDPVFSGAGLALAPSAFRFTSWALDKGLNTEEELSLAANFKRELELGDRKGSIKFGVKYRAKDRDVDITSDVINPAAGVNLTLADVGRTSSRGVTGTFPSVNPAAFRAYYAANLNNFVKNANASLVNATVADYTTSEDILAGYLMGELGFGKLTVIGGARVEHTDYTNQAWSIEDEDPSTLARVRGERTYTNVLPGLITRYDFSERMVGRASVTSTLARPKYLDASASRSVEDDDITQGNPNLKPYASTNWDASMEFYPVSLGVFTVGVFHKEISDFIFSQVIAGGAPNGINSLTTPLNGDTASVTGLEADYQQQFSFLPAPFDGIGINANITLTDSDSELGGSRSGESVPFLNQSKRLANFAISYEKNGFFLRVSAAHRSRYLGLIGASTAGDQYVEDHLQIDVSTNYKISPRYTIYAEALNVGNEPYSSVYNVSNGLRKAEFYSWAANFGIKASF